jgi:hypothetical protein
MLRKVYLQLYGVLEALFSGFFLLLLLFLDIRASLIIISGIITL